MATSATLTTETTTTRKIGRNKGKARLWIEGATLTAAGLARGTRWALEQTPEGLTIRRDAEGSRKVAGMPGRPIIDILGASLGVCAGAAVVSLTYTPGSGIIEVRGVAS